MTALFLVEARNFRQRKTSPHAAQGIANRRTPDVRPGRLPPCRPGRAIHALPSPPGPSTQASGLPPQEIPAPEKGDRWLLRDVQPPLPQGEGRGTVGFGALITVRAIAVRDTEAFVFAP